jgi:spermidine synthase
VNSRASTRSILCVAALAGACSMIVELAAVRLIAPWFGTSSAVWTNVIGVVLLALSSGYLLGARLSRLDHPRRVLGLILLMSAACSSWLPALAGPVARCFLPQGLTLEEAARILKWGSLATGFVLFMPSALLLGCIPPLAAEILERATPRGAGSSGGRVLAASTLGSLVGTFSTTYLALPVLGLTRTFLVCGGILGALAVWVLWQSRRGGVDRAMGFLAPVPIAWFLARLGSPDVPEGFKLLESVESSYQSSRIIEGDVDGVRWRRLQVNEGFDSFQSVWREEPGPLPMGYYYNLFALPPWWSASVPRWRVLVLGIAGGTSWRVFENALPAGTELESTGVEIDPAIVGLGERWMQLPRADPERRILADWDARTALRQVEGEFEEVVLDAYANQMEIPAHLTTVEFFREVRSRLVPGGWLCVNIGAFGLTDPIVEAVSGTVARAFEQRALVVRVPFSRNCVLFARRGDLPPDPSAARTTSRSAALDTVMASIALPGASRWYDSIDSLVLTDDLNPIEELQRRSILEGPERLREQR